MNIFFSGQNTRTAPTESKLEGRENNYISKIIVRPVPKPRNISLIGNNLTSETNRLEVDNNSNIQKEKGSKDHDLMLFTSPEKPASEFNDVLRKLQDFNKNQAPLSQLSHLNSFAHSNLSSSQSVSLGMFNNFSNLSSSSNNGRFVWKPENITNGTLRTTMPYSSNFPSLFSTQSSFTVSPNIPLGPDPSIAPPPLPNRSPIVDMRKLSIGLNQTPPQTSVSTSFSSTLSSSSFHTSKSQPFGQCSVISASLSQPISKDLIDLQSEKHTFKHSNKDNLFSSLLEDFDPLKAKSKPKGAVSTPVEAKHDVPISDDAKELLNYKASREVKEDEQSYYEQVDPFQYMQPSGASTRSDPVTDIYDGLGSPGVFGGETFDTPPPLPPRVSQKIETPVMRKHSSTKRNWSSIKKVSFFSQMKVFYLF